MKKYVDKKIDKIGAVLGEEQGKVDSILNRATDKLGKFIGKKKDKLKEELPEISIDVDGDHWDLGGFLDRRAKKFTKFINKKSSKLEKMLDKKMQEFPERKEKFVDELPDVDIESAEPKTDVEDIIDHGINDFGRMFDDLSEGITDSLDGILQ